MYRKLQKVADIRRSEERERKTPLLIWSTANKKDKLKENNLEGLRINQKSELSKLPIKSNWKIFQNKDKNPHCDKLDNLAEGQSRRYKFCRNLNKRLGALKANQSLEDRRESITLNKIFAKLSKNNQTIDALKEKLKCDANHYGSKDRNRNSFEEIHNMLNL